MAGKAPDIFNKDTGIVAVSEMTSSGVIGTGVMEHLAERFPGAMDKVRNFVSRYLIEPYLEKVETRFQHLLHDRFIDHGKRTGEQRTEALYNQLPRSERVRHVTNIFIKESSEFITETGITLATESVLKRAFHAKISPAKIMMVGAGVQLGTIASMGLLHKPVDHLYHKLAEILPKVSGIEPEKAEHFVRHALYVGMSGTLGMAAELVLAQREHGGKR